LRRFILLLLFFVFGLANAQTSEVSLNGSWKFRKAGDIAWLDATVPGTVHTDLLNNKIVQDPFYGTNEKDLQWIENEDWEYVTTFNCSPALLSSQKIELVFEGLDTYAEVYLNDSLILTADNMFRTWKVDCKQYVKAKNNELRIFFESAVRKGKEAAKKLPYTLPGDEKVFTRKAQYHYGWDWGPRFVTCGIWKSVSLIAWSKIKIEDVQVLQRTLTDSLAELEFVFTVNCTEEGEYVFSVLSDRKETKSIHIKGGLQQASIRYRITKPKLWWPSGLGNASLYSFNCEVSQGNIILDTRNIKFGLRTVEHVQEKDSIGTSFYFKVNGIPVFMKGANWIPSDNFLPRVSDDKYRSLLVKAAEANMNMLRVWGGGIYESDMFYSLCDSLGILVWQDFMFACAMYPGDSSFISNVREEVIDNVSRLRNHPCLALWCGNNEIDEGWKNWGWEKQYGYSVKDSAQIWNDYRNLFEKVIPATVQLLDSRNYISTSPQHGWGRKESLMAGDCHYWGVWWGLEPFEAYEKKIGRFMSEYGFQGMPTLSTFRKFCDTDELTLSSAMVKHHQKHLTGYETIQTYLNATSDSPRTSRTTFLFRRFCRQKV
jgi:beta-mannosidase